MSDALAASYDDFPYESRPFIDAHPDRLATMAILFGITPAPVETARVLEIGCAAGGNLVPMGLELPNARLVGIDLSPRQVAAARSLVKQVGVTNVELQAMSLLDIDEDFGEFDYIICHGVYSWIPPEAQRHVLTICQRNLAPNGVAFVSYNTFPGWHTRQMIREMMFYHVESVSDAKERVRRARVLIDWLAVSSPDRNVPYARKLAEEAEALKGADDSYILHEFLEVYNEPIYYQEFLRRVDAANLKVFADARYRQMAECQPEGLQKALGVMSGEMDRREQYHDFLRDRTFRRSLLCHPAVGAAPLSKHENIDRLRVSTLVRAMNPRPDLLNATVEEFRNPDATIRVTSDNPVVKAMLVTLVEAHPRSLPFRELFAAALARLDHLSPAKPANVDRATAAATVYLLRAYAYMSVDLHAYEPSFALEPSTRPVASPLSRLQVTDASVTTLRHQLTKPSSFDRLVLRQLDGTRTHAQIVEELIKAVRAGEFSIHQNLQPVTDPELLRPILTRSLAPSLRRLANSMLLVA
jgi:methyltransferase-like protein/2-polyprenyl-3-methyl-5-hydroxy-6-metoxy-1,4-benzoquinol methylase